MNANSHHQPTLHAGQTLTTDRFRLQPIAPADEERLHELFLDREVRRYLLDDAEMPIEFVRSVVADSQELFEREGLGIWGVWTTDKGPTWNLMGFVGFRHFFDPPELQLLYGLHPKAWGRGVATEAADTVMRHALRTSLEEVIAATDPPNEASVEVMKRLGMTYWKTESRDQQETIYYRMRRDDLKAS